MNMALTTDPNTVQNIIQTNLIGTINVCQAITPLMVRKKWHYYKFFNHCCATFS